MSAVRDLRNVEQGAPIKKALFGGYSKGETEQYILQLEKQLKEAQVNYSEKAEELKTRIDALTGERNKSLSNERELTEKAETLAAKNIVLETEVARLKYEQSDMREKLSRFSEEAGISFEGYTRLCTRLSEAEDENMSLRAQVKELSGSLAARQSENEVLSESFNKTMTEKDALRHELYTRLTAAREERDLVCMRFVEAAARQQASADDLRTSLEKAVKLLDGLTVDAVSLVASLTKQMP